MSRVGKKTITIPEKVKVKNENGVVFVDGPKGKLNFRIPANIEINLSESEIVLTRTNEEKKTAALHGTTRAMINNMIVGVSVGFTRELEIIGVGYKAEAKGKELVLALGYSHPVIFPLPDGVEAKVDKQTKVVLSGYDKQVLGEVAAKIRKLRPPEPYKGKGVRFAGEVVKHKVGKTAAGAGA